jgi:hypothetical protein
MQPNGILLAGNQRTNAAIKAGRTSIDAYVIKPCLQALIDDFIRRDNCRHGKALSEEDMIRTCVELHRRHGRPINAVNELYFGGNSKTYSRIVIANQAAEVEERLLRKNVIAGRLPTTALAAMHPVSDLTVLKETAGLMLDYSLPIAQVQEIVKATGGMSSEKERLEYVKEKKAELERKTKTGSSFKPDTSLRRHLASMRKTIETGCDGKPFPSIESLFGDKAQREEATEAVNAIIGGLKRLKERTR